VTVEPRDFGLGCDEEPDLPMFGPPEEGQGTGDNPALVKAAGDVTAAVLAGEHGAARNATLLGAALVLKAAGRCHTIAEGVSEASEALDSGEARGVLERIRALG
jgi:anthranilate phosphoribosyltransferase